MPPQNDSEMSGELALEQFLPYRLSVLSNRVSQTIAASYRDRFALSVTEWRVIAVLGRTPNLSASEVVERTAMDKVAISRAVAALLDRGLLLRAVDREDRRRWLLTLSDKGAEVHAQVAPLALAFEARLLAALDAGEQRQLQRLLHKLEQALPMVGHG
ncbi:MarR family winged helix-turn-helix transcriptional regulator [Luteimonas sp. e5]